MEFKVCFKYEIKISCHLEYAYLSKFKLWIYMHCFHTLSYMYIYIYMKRWDETSTQLSLFSLYNIYNQLSYLIYIYIYIYIYDIDRIIRRKARILSIVISISKLCTSIVIVNFSVVSSTRGFSYFGFSTLKSGVVSSL